MSSPLHSRSEGSTDPADGEEDEGENRSSLVRITVIVQDRYTFDTEVATGKQIKETANIPPGFVLYRRAEGGNERIPDDAPVELRNGDHFFARPPSNSGISRPGSDTDRG